MAAYTVDGRAAAHQPAECDGSCGGFVVPRSAVDHAAMERHLQRAYGPGGPGHNPERGGDVDRWTLAMFSRADAVGHAGLWRRALGLLQLDAERRQVQLSRLAASWSRRRPSVRPPAVLAALVLACPHTGPPARRELLATTAPGAPVIYP